MVVSVTSSDYYTCFAQGNDLLLWEYNRDKVLHIPNALSSVLVVRAVDDKLMVLTEEGIVHVWHVDRLNNATFIVAMNLSERGFDLPMRLKLCGSDLNLVDIREPEPAIIDCCRVSEFLAIGVTSEAVCWMKNSSVICQFDAWYGVGSRKEHEGTLESLQAVGANMEVVCVASSFGNVFVLDRKTMEWKRTLPIGEDIVSMSLPPTNDNTMVIGSRSGAVKVVNFERFQVIEYIK